MENASLLWREAVKANSIYKEEDTVVPRYELPKLLKGIKEIGAKYGFQSVCYGHAGDGNLHVNIIKGNMTDDNWKTEVPKGIREIFELTVRLKGTLIWRTRHWLGTKKLHGYCVFKSTFGINGTHQSDF
jgi:FAD/FMN-containing dehydrogenase